MRRGGLPKAIDVKACLCCNKPSEVVVSEEHPELDMGETETEELSSLRKPSEEPSNTDVSTCPRPGS